MDFEIIEVGGLKYRLQNIPNRERIRLKQKVVNVISKEVNLELIFDYAFEHCVFPEGHTHEPNLDNCTSEEMEVWEKILPNFCLTGKFAEPSKGGKKQNKK